MLAINVPGLQQKVQLPRRLDPWVFSANELMHVGPEHSPVFINTDQHKPKKYLT